MTDELLEKIDRIRSRFPVSYEEAKGALEQTGGNLVEALIFLEKKEHDDHDGQAGEILDRVKKLWQKGNQTRIKIKKGDNVLVQVPATVGVLSAVISPHLTFLGTIAALAGRCRIEVEKEGTFESID